MSERQPTRDEFASALNTKFRLALDHTAQIELELVEVSELRSYPKQKTYSIVFYGPKEIMLPQHIYQLQHAQLGAFDLFIVPIGLDERGYTYEAVFNYLA